MHISKKNNFIIIAITLFVFVVCSFVPFPRYLKAPCVLLPLYEWTIYQPESDKIITKLTNNDKGVTEQFTTFQYNRPDVVNFQLVKELEVGKSINKGDTVAQILSLEEQLELSRLIAEFNKTENTISSLKAGEKPALIKEAEQALEYANSQKLAFLPQLARRRELFKNGLITQEEFEIAETEFNLLAINEKIQKTTLDGLTSGVKQERTAIAESELAGLQKQIELSLEKSKTHKFISPINGLFSKSLDSSIFINIVQIDTLVVHIPIPIEKSHYLAAGQNVTLVSLNYKLNTELVLQSPIAQHIAGKPFIISGGIIDNLENLFKPFHPVAAKINCGQTSVAKIIADEWATFKFSRLN